MEKMTELTAPEKAQWLTDQLDYLSQENGDSIESDDFEILIESDSGSSVYTASITTLAGQAAQRIRFLESALQAYAKYENKEAMERDIRLLNALR